MTSDSEYVLGTSDEEIARLELGFRIETTRPILDVVAPSSFVVLEIIARRKPTLRP